MPNRGPIHSKPTPLEQQRVFNREWKRFNNQLNRARLTWYAFAKQIPDMLTLLRLILALVLFGSGLIDGEAYLARDIWLLVIAWTTDMADGRISRSLKKEHRLVGVRIVWPAAVSKKYELIQGIVDKQKSQNTSWLGQNDVYVDMIVSIAVLGYLTVTSLLPLWLSLAYLLIWGVLFLRWGVPDVFAQVFQNPIYAVFVFLTVQSEPAVLPWLLLWAAVALIFFWRRMLQLLKGLFRAVRRS
jgi:hypothetical protein